MLDDRDVVVMKRRWGETNKNKNTAVYIRSDKCHAGNEVLRENHKDSRTGKGHTLEKAVR